MRKALLLTLFLAAIAPFEARASLASDELLSYVAMPLAVSDVCAVRGVQTDQVGTLVAYMDQANVSPQGFIEVFRYVPVALVLNAGDQPDFVRWVGGEVARGVNGDELVRVMKRQLRTYDRVVPVSRSYRHRPRRIYRTVFAEEYVPVRVRRYCSRALLDPYALIDMPVAVAHVCDLGVPYDRVGRLVTELNLGYVEPWQTVELLRYAPSALVVADSGQPDFVQFVYEQRAGGLSGYGLVRAIDRRLPAYDVVPRIDRPAPVYVRNYVDPVDPAYVPHTVRAHLASRFGPPRLAGRKHDARRAQIVSPPYPEPGGGGQPTYVVAPPVSPPRPPEVHGHSRGRRHEVPLAPPAFAPPAQQPAPFMAPAPQPQPQPAAQQGRGRGHEQHEQGEQPGGGKGHGQDHGHQDHGQTKGKGQ
jgi:hypothetical protein